MTDKVYTVLDLAVIDETEPILIGDRFRFIAEQTYQLLPSVFAGSPDVEALDLAKKIQTELYMQGLDTIRTKVEGLDIGNDTMHFSIELEVVDVVDSSHPGHGVEVGLNKDGTQVVLAGNAVKDITTGKTINVVFAALAIIAAAGAAGTFILSLNKQVVYLERLLTPDLAPTEDIAPAKDLRAIAVAAGVATIFYFLSKVPR